MRIAFIDFNLWDYNVGSVRLIPMGGTQSAGCYLAVSLAAMGHQVFYLNGTRTPGIFEGVDCRTLRKLQCRQLRELQLDVLIVIQVAARGRSLLGCVSPNTRIILWTGDTPNQKVVADLSDPAERDVYDRFALVSVWQAEHFHRRFGIERSRMGVLGYAMSPPFANLFRDGQSILSQKAAGPVLAYASTPHRGLELLLDLFPAIRARMPGTRLRVFSGRTLHGLSAEADAIQFAALYDRCRTLEGAEFFGALPHAQLAEKMRKATMLAYPNIYEETYCVAAIEAMAAGCKVVSSAQGALPETTAGFARLVPVRDYRPDPEQFVEAVIEELEGEAENPAAAETRLREQLQFVQAHCTWPCCAAQWMAWLKKLVG